MMRLSSLLIQFAICVGCLAGCQGEPAGVLRSTAPFMKAATPLSPDAFLRCLLDQQPFATFRMDGRLQVLTLPSGETEITIGALQMSVFRNYYLLKIAGNGTTTEVTAWRAPGTFAPLSESELRTELARCGTRVNA